MNTRLDPTLDEDFPGKFSYVAFWIGLAISCIGMVGVAGSQSGGWSRLGNFIGYAILWLLSSLYTLIFGAIAWVREYQLRDYFKVEKRYTALAGRLYRYAALVLAVFGYLLFRGA
jgi:hypothetical protein